METHGRERRHRYFTVANYRKLVAQEELDKNCAGYADIDLDNVGGFLPISTDLFYDTENSLVQYLDAFNDNDKTRGRKSKKPPKKSILPDGKTKRGRPRKNPANDGETLFTESIQKSKRKRGEVADTSTHGFPTETLDDPTKKRPRLLSEVEEQSGKPSRHCSHLLYSNSLYRFAFFSPKKRERAAIKIKGPREFH
jgi:transcription factor C subunit 3